jgi:Flp pilus assembly protein TadG
VLDALMVRVRSLVSGDGRDRGAAVAEFVMVSVLLVFLLFAVLQVAVFFYVRNVVAASAADGARYAAAAGVDYGSGGSRASDLVGRGLTTGVARDVPCQGRPDTDAATGLPLAVVHCSGRIRSAFLPIGALLNIDVTSGALKEGPP